MEARSGAAAGAARGDGASPPFVAGRLDVISDREFAGFQRLIYDLAGISLAGSKKALVCGRLGKRLRELELGSYAEYLRLIVRRERRDELQHVIDLLTTNETFFFREAGHFDFLRRLLRERPPARPVRVWSAAASSGEEAYSIAMVLADCLGETGWEVVGTDISQRVLARAQTASYPLDRTKTIPREYLHRYCLKGVGARAGTFTIDPALRERVSFKQLNLNEPLSGIGMFDIVFLRNVLIYFNVETKRQVVERVAGALKPHGFLLVGHSEGLHGLTTTLQAAGPSIYRRPMP